MDSAPPIPLRVAELLCSRLCHDLISPVAAVSNGLELLADDSGGLDAEIMGLLSSSVAQAAGRLTFFRAAYGFGGAAADELSLADAADCVRGLIEGDSIEAALPDGTEALGRGPTKLFLNAAALGLEALPRAGRLTVRVETGDALAIEVAAEGTGAALRPETIAALAADTDVEALSARSVQGYLTAWLARAMGGSLTLASGGGDAVRFAATLPTGRA